MPVRRKGRLLRVLRAEDEAAWTALVSPWKSAMPTQFYRPVGCLDCRMTGYKGRVGIYEIMPMSAEIKKLVAEGVELARLREQAMREATDEIMCQIGALLPEKYRGVYAEHPRLKELASQ